MMKKISISVFITLLGMACTWAQAPANVEQLREELQRMQEQFELSKREQQAQIEKLTRQIEALRNEGSQPALAESGQSSHEGCGSVSTTGRSETVSDRAGTPLLSSRDGRAFMDIGLVGTFSAGTSTADDVDGGLQLGGHDPRQRGFTVQGLELNLSGAVDPYFRGAANVLFSIDSEGESYLELEEAWLETISLPGTLQLRAGQILTEFGRQNPTHVHSWSFVDTPLVLGRMFGPDGLRNPGGAALVDGSHPLFTPNSC
jgi:hypothetical protein